MDNPEAALDLLTRILDGASFQDGSQDAFVPVSRDQRDLEEDETLPAAPKIPAGSVRAFRSSVRVNFTTVADADSYRV
eukprot:6875565-Prorocentrum_lima.AAC.1